MPRLAPQDALAATMRAITEGHLPPPDPRGRPAAGVGVAIGNQEVHVIGGRRMQRVPAGLLSDPVPLFSGRRPATKDDALLLQAMGLWDSSTTSAAHTSTVTGVDAPALTYLARRGAVTRRHMGSSAAATAWSGVAVAVQGGSTLADTLRTTLSWAWPHPSQLEQVGPTIRLVVDMALDPSDDGVQIPVMLSEDGSAILCGPWTAQGEIPCPACVSRWQEGHLAAPARQIDPEAPPIKLGVALVLTELMSSLTGTGRGLRPGVGVRHTIEDTGAPLSSRFVAVAPQLDCGTCAGGGPVSEASRARIKRDLDEMMLWAPPPRRWNPPAAHEVHFTPAALEGQHTPTTGRPVPSSSFTTAVLATRDEQGVVTRSWASAGNLGAGALLIGGEADTLQLRWQPDKDGCPGGLLASPVPLPRDVVPWPRWSVEAGSRTETVRVAVEEARLELKYGRGARALAFADAGSLLGHCLWSAENLSLAVELLPSAVRRESGFILGHGLRLGQTANSTTIPCPRQRSLRKVTWNPKDATILWDALDRARARCHVATPLTWHFVTGPAVGNLLHQRNIGHRAGLFFATADLCALPDDPEALNVARYWAGCLLTLVSLYAGQSGLRGCLVQGLSPVATAAYLGVGLLPATPLMGWVVGRPERDRP